uniref:Uncharacterized protein n=1 Tax=Ascaris lumbricoides TaxID=6252 RepID=A0A0M3HJZ3_ASCLU
MSSSPVPPSAEGANVSYVFVSCLSDRRTRESVIRVFVFPPCERLGRLHGGKTKFCITWTTVFLWLGQRSGLLEKMRGVAARALLCASLISPMPYLGLDGRILIRLFAKCFA